MQSFRYVSGGYFAELVEDGEVVELPYVEGIEDALRTIHKAYRLKKKAEERFNLEAFLLDQAKKIADNGNLREILLETARYYRKEEK